jgi:D-alanyl-D-alanine carboxypeptidase
VELPSQRVILSHRSLVSLEIASLTKIMTFHTVLSLAAQHAIDIAAASVVVSGKAGAVGGTSAELGEGEEYTLEQLLYGLMLPSGNDAANELAYWGGQLLGGEDHRAMQKAFVAEMNRLARLLDLRNSKFANPHGLPHHEARSTAADLAKLCAHCMALPLFRKITSCRVFRARVGSGSGSRVVEWENTNKLLRREGFAGLKTGITVTAGPCLAAAYHFRDKTYISVILRAPKVSARFKETRLLIWWTLGRLYKDLSEGERAQLRQLRRHDR